MAMSDLEGDLAELMVEAWPFPDMTDDDALAVTALAERLASAFQPIGSWSRTSYGIALFGEPADPKRSPRVHGTAYAFRPDLLEYPEVKP
jgi:hypothetical protein